ncbi:MAG: stage II sporulation protein R [Eubacteriales bacterium]
MSFIQREPEILNGKGTLNDKLLRAVAVFCATFLILTTLCSFMPVHGEERIYTDVIRLHVLANSDSDGDQALKLLVRDEILVQVAEITKGCEDMSSAAAALNADMDKLIKTASEVIVREGYSYPVTATLGQEDYPERTYDDTTFPAGRYNSLRIMIGTAEGHNWWCVLFPPVCLSGSRVDSELASSGFTKEQIKTYKTNGKVKYKIRLKILEIFGCYK